MRGVREEGRGREKQAELYRALERERDGLLQQVKSLSMNSLMVSQSKTSREAELELLRRSVVGLEQYISEQKASIEGLNKMLGARQKEIEALESSNATLRKQIIASIASEESSRKEVLECKNRAGSVLDASRVRPRSNRNTSFKGFRSRASIEGSLNGMETYTMRTAAERLSNFGAVTLKESLVK